MRVPNPKFQVYTDRTSGLYHFQLRAANGRIVMTSSGHQQKQLCMAAILLCRKLSLQDNAYKINHKGSRYTFSLYDTSGACIATSRYYSTANARNHGMASVKSNACNAALEDVTAVVSR